MRHLRAVLPPTQGANRTKVGLKHHEEPLIHLPLQSANRTKVGLKRESQ